MIQNRLIKRNIGLCLKWKRFEGTVSVGSYVVFCLVVLFCEMFVKKMEDGDAI